MRAHSLPPSSETRKAKLVRSLRTTTTTTATHQKVERMLVLEETHLGTYRSQGCKKSIFLEEEYRRVKGLKDLKGHSDLKFSHFAQGRNKEFLLSSALATKDKG